MALYNKLLFTLASNAKMVFATGRGIQPRGMRINDSGDFKVHTKGAGSAELKIQIFGPGGVECKCKQVKSTKEEGVWECVYIPTKVGQYIVNVTYGETPIAKSPFRVDVAKLKTSKIRAYGPGLEGGVVGQPARFTVETNGEVGALGTSCSFFLNVLLSLSYNMYIYHINLTNIYNNICIEPSINLYFRLVLSCIYIIKFCKKTNSI